METQGVCALSKDHRSARGVTVVLAKIGNARNVRAQDAKQARLLYDKACKVLNVAEPQYCTILCAVREFLILTLKYGFRFRLGNTLREDIEFAIFYLDALYADQKEKEGLVASDVEEEPQSDEDDIFFSKDSECDLTPMPSPLRDGEVEEVGAANPTIPIDEDDWW